MSLSVIIETRQNDNSSSVAIGLLERMQSMEFILSMFVAETFLDSTNPLSQQLQSVQMTIGRACSLIYATQDSLKTLKTYDSFQSIYDKANEFAIKHDIETNIQSNEQRQHLVSSKRSNRIRTVSKKLSDYLVEANLGQRSNLNSSGTGNLTDNYYETVFEPALERILSEFDQRLVDHCETFESMACYDIE